ncbi:MAG: NADPH-dependent FMN reductase [Patescibacteria group bacterium]
MKVLGFVGSLRKGSYNRALYNEFVARLPKDWTIEEGHFGDFPLFNEDTEGSAPAAVAELKQKIADADALVIVTPEYNRSVPGGLKNMLDWTSRKPFNWPGKKAYVFGSSSGERGANLAQFDIKRTLLYFGCRVLGQPEFYLSNNTQKFDAQMRLTDEPTKQALDRAVVAFVEFCK